MKNYFLKNQEGVTLAELMVVIAMIAIMSAVFILNIKQDRYGDVKMITEKLLADVKYARSLATSKAVYDFSGVKKFPEHGYGVDFIGNNTGTGEPASYQLFADGGAPGYKDENEDRKIGQPVIFPSAKIKLIDAYSSKKLFYISFASDNQVETNVALDLDSRYPIKVEYAPGYPQTTYRSIILLAEESKDGLTFANIGYYFEKFTPAAPTSGGTGGEKKVNPGLIE
jgi:prepilin-type N-terminal cleavage/methylation domain-containing protein